MRAVSNLHQASITAIYCRNWGRFLSRNNCTKIEIVLLQIWLLSEERLSHKMWNMFGGKSLFASENEHIHIYRLLVLRFFINVKNHVILGYHLLRPSLASICSSYRSNKRSVATYDVCPLKWGFLLYLSLYYTSHASTRGESIIFDHHNANIAELKYHHPVTSYWRRHMKWIDE